MSTSPAGKPAAEKPNEVLEALAGAVVYAGFALSAAMERVHGEGAFSSGRRALLLNLRDMGEATVPKLAAMRSVSRQYIQQLIDALREERLVAARDNPAHRRSPLYRLTQKGSTRLEAMLARETPLFEALSLAVDAKEAVRVTRLLRELRTIADKISSQASDPRVK